jgi:hypothetical protein
MKWIVVTRPACDLRMRGALCPTCMFVRFRATIAAVSDFSVPRFPGTHLRSRLEQKCEAILLEYRLSGH